MVNEDFEILRSLVNKYTLSHVVDALSKIALNKAGEFADEMLNRNAKEWSSYSVLLERISRLIAG